MSLKRRLVITIILMVVIPVLLIALLGGALFLGMFLEENGPVPADFVQVDREALRTQLRPGTEMYRTVLLWAAAAALLVVSSFTVGTVYISRKLLIPLRALTGSVRAINAGDLDGEVLTTGVAEVDELCTAVDELRLRLRRSVSEQLESDRQRSMMLANLSHDLRTPVTAIKGYADGLREGVAATEEMRRRYIDTIYSRASDLERMIEQTSDFSELELGRMRFDFAETDGAAFVRELAADFTTDFEAAGAALTLRDETGGAVLPVKLDRMKLRRVFANLFSNALKYRDPDRPLAVRVLLTAGPGTLRVSVADNGVGIDSEAQGRVFEGFYRADPARHGPKGHGLGLAIAKQIVDAHGGRITLQSKVGEGTTVTVVLPLVK